MDKHSKGLTDDPQQAWQQEMEARVQSNSKEITILLRRVQVLEEKLQPKSHYLGDKLK